MNVRPRDDGWTFVPQAPPSVSIQWSENDPFSSRSTAGAARAIQLSLSVAKAAS
jgi:hypothetical protein